MLLLLCVLWMHNETQYTLTVTSRISEVHSVKQISFFAKNHARINTQWSKEVISGWRENETHTHHYHDTSTKNLISALTKGRINHLRVEHLKGNFILHIAYFHSFGHHSYWLWSHSTHQHHCSNITQQKGTILPEHLILEVKMRVNIKVLTQTVHYKHILT